MIICGSRISELRPHHEDHAGSSAAVLVPVDGEEDWLIPGWIDLQVNDMEWLDSAMNGERKDKSDHAQRIEKVLEYQIKQGVTHMLLVRYYTDPISKCVDRSCRRVPRKVYTATLRLNFMAFFGDLIRSTVAMGTCRLLPWEPADSQNVTYMYLSYYN